MSLIALLFACAEEAEGGQAETLTTRDGVELAADVYPKKDASGVVLLHMIPPHWDRTSWPASFITSLGNEGWSVCVLDRRGAGESKGKAEDAYVGEKGRYDVEACVKRLQKDGLKKLAVIGASNGTTSTIDYADWAASEELPVPAVMGMMTGGTYTEKQTKMKAMAAIPTVFTYSTEEKSWSEAQKGKSEVWTFHEYPGGDHGTKMFDVKPEVANDLLTALKARL